MAVKKSDSGGKGKGTTYLTIKMGGDNVGHFVGASANGYAALEADSEATGVLAGISIVDATIKSDKPGAAPGERMKTGQCIRVFLREDDPNEKHTSIDFQVVYGEDVSPSAMKILAKLAQVDPTQPVSIRPYLGKKGAYPFKGADTPYERDTPQVTIQQGGISFKGTFPTPDGKLPERAATLKADGTPIKVNGRQLYESGPWLALLETMYADLEARVLAAHPRRGEAPDRAHDHGEPDEGFDPADAADAADAALAQAAARESAAAPARESFRARA